MIAPLPVLILVHLLHLQPDGGVGDDDGQLLFPFPLLLPHLLLPCGPWTANQGYFSPSFNLLLFLDSGATVFHEPLGQPLDRGGERCDLHLLCQEPRTI